MKRISASIYDEIRAALKARLETVREARYLLTPKTTANMYPDSAGLCDLRRVPERQDGDSSRRKYHPLRKHEKAPTNPTNRSSTAWAASGDLSGVSTLRHIIPRRTEGGSFPFMVRNYTWSSERHVKAYVVFRFVLSVIVEVLYQVVYTCARRICTISHKA